MRCVKHFIFFVRFIFGSRRRRRRRRCSLNTKILFASCYFICCCCFAFSFARSPFRMPFHGVDFRVFICHCINIIFSSHHIVSTLLFILSFSPFGCVLHFINSILFIILVLCVRVPLLLSSFFLFHLACKHIRRLPLTFFLPISLAFSVFHSYLFIFLANSCQTI